MMTDTRSTQFYERLFRQNERVMKFGLDAINAALAREPELCTYRHILIAGTNGKGQVSALIANALHMNGYKVGLFTSPHLVDFRERIRVNGRCIPLEDVIEIGTSVLRTYGGEENPEYSGITLTYFECCLMMALRYFKKSGVDFGVFEVGLGGRLDATNALNPNLSIITSISLDHEAYLGNSTDKIAREKAGIMRPGRPVICGRQETDVLYEEARNHKCFSFDALGTNFDWTDSKTGMSLNAGSETYPLPCPKTMPDYQKDNLAVAAFSLLKMENMGLTKSSLSMPHILQTLASRTRWVGRMWPCSDKTAERLKVHQIILDGAHNPDGVRAFCNAVKNAHDFPRALIVNSCRDKDVDLMYPQYLEVFKQDEIFVVPINTTQRACTPEEYCERVGHPKNQSCTDLAVAFERASAYVGKSGTIYISGSLYLLGQVITWLGEESALETIDNKDKP